MAPTTDTLVLSTNFLCTPGEAVQVAPALTRVTAPNASAYTFTGTNSFLIGTERVCVLDPGPDDPAHLAALMAAIDGRKVDAIVLTHTHTDHSALAKRLKTTTGAPIWSGGPHRLSRPARLFEINPVQGSSDWGLVPDRVLADGESIDAGGVALKVLATPGHCANHLSFGVTGTPYMFTGDHVMGWSSTLVAVPDGSMEDYLASIIKTTEAPFGHYLPAHGGEIADGPRHARALLAHRQARNEQIVECLGKGVQDRKGLLAAIYPQLSGRLRRAALMTLDAHIEYLSDRGQISQRWTPMGRRLTLS